jgi:hypothetical protein
MLICTLASCKRLIYWGLVNWLPWSLLKMSGLARPNAHGFFFLENFQHDLSLKARRILFSHINSIA